MQELKLGGEWIQGPYQMISGQDEAVSRKYKLVIGKDGHDWLYNDDLPDAGAFVYVSGGPSSKGFGGATIDFQLVDGTKHPLKGPWHTNPDALFKATGVDLRSRHVTWGCIGTGREFKQGDTVVTGLLYFDPPQGVEGSFNRVKDLAKDFAHQRGEEVVFYSQSHGGSSCGFTHCLEKAK